ncbi:hypothetical protein BRC81_10345 [Halobacteriales archaeon QS_1_68_20]|nr:MAG: hypothetical protein BRC81_10345 [Halobacteriales archaeon QS_1_68_20]
MSDLAADRIYDDRTGKQDVYVASGQGVAVVEVSHRVGRFRLDRRCTARDVAAADGLVAVATDEDVLLLDRADESDAESGGEAPGDESAEYVETGFGPASAVGFDEGALVAAGDDEFDIGRLLHPREDPTEWLTVADVDAPVRAIDGPLLAADDGVYQLTADEIADVGLDDARDVAAVGPFAATGDGCYRLGPGWTRDLEDAFDVVAAASSDGELALAHAATADALYAFDGEWDEREVAESPVADVAYGATTYAVTADGTFLADGGDRWERRSLGLRDVVAVAVP